VALGFVLLEDGVEAFGPAGLGPEGVPEGEVAMREELGIDESEDEGGDAVDGIGAGLGQGVRPARPVDLHPVLEGL